MRNATTTWLATIGYVRSLNIGHLSVWCEGKREGGWPCHHSGTVSIAGLPDDMTLRSIERRMLCEACGAIGAAEVRPDWSEITARPSSGAAGWMTPPSLRS